MRHPDSEAALKKLTSARAQLLLNKGHGFFGSLALRLRLVEKPDVKTLAVDGKRMFYNPEFVVHGLTDSLTRSAIAHEVMHCVLDHMSRLTGRNPRKWNMATDYAINLILEDSGFEIGKGWLLSRQYANLTADEIYAMLPDETGHGPGGDEGEPLDELRPGEPIEHEHDTVDWKLATVQAINAAKAMGQVPGGLQRFIEDVTAPPKVDWRAQLRQFINQVAKDDYSWSRPNRRYLSAGVYLPGLWSENMGEMAVVIDTSGSIDQRTLDVFGNEIKALVSSLRPIKTHVIYCDSEINRVDAYEAHDPLKFELCGGGGTDFRPPFEYLQQQGITPVCLVYLTDLWGPQPDYAEFPVLWVCTTSEVGQIGETIHIEV